MKQPRSLVSANTSSQLNEQSLPRRCLDTFKQTVTEYQDLHGHELKWALLFDTCDAKRTLFVIIYAEEFELLSPTDYLMCGGKSLKLVATIRDSVLEITCGMEYFRTFFTADGKDWRQEVLYQDRILAQKKQLEQASDGSSEQEV
jgi:hypothetical protein